MTLSTIITARVQATLSNALDLATGTVPLDKLARYTWTSGTGASQSDLVFHDQRTISASSNEDLDLAGSLSDAFGSTLTFVEVRGLLVVASTGNANNVQVSQPASNGVPGIFLAAGDGTTVYPGGSFMWVTPNNGDVTVTASTGDLINIANSGAGTSVTYDVVIIGASA